MTVDEDHAPTTPHLDVGGILRAARAVCGLSQRQLALASGVSKSTIARIEADADGRRTSAHTLACLLAACGIELVPHGAKGRLLPDTDPERDRQGRRYPPHLDPSPPMSREDWWAVRRYYEGIVDSLVPWPPRTFALDRFRLTRDREVNAPSWDARFWQVTVDHAPAFMVHPELERRRAIHAGSGRSCRTAATPSELRRVGWHWVEGSATRGEP